MKTLNKVKFDTNEESIQSLLINLLKRNKFDYKELSYILNISGGDVRSRINVARKNGVPIIDECFLDKDTNRKRKKYFITKNEKDYLRWRCDQAYSSIDIRLGSPGYDYNR